MNFVCSKLQYRRLNVRESEELFEEKFIRPFFYVLVFPVVLCNLKFYSTASLISLQSKLCKGIIWHLGILKRRSQQPFALNDHVKSNRFGANGTFDSAKVT